MPSWLRPPRRIFWGSTTNTAPASRPEVLGVREIYSSTTSTSEKPAGSDLTYSVLETPEMNVDVTTIEKFRAAFAYDEKENLLGCNYQC